MARKTVKAAGKKPAKPKRAQQKATPLHAGVKWEAAFIASLRDQGVVRAACEAAEIVRSTAYRRRDESLAFAAQWDEALQDFADTLEAEAIRRARDGTIKGIYHQGVLMNTELQYSDTLMTQMLKAKRPDEYGDKLIIKLDPEHVALLKKAGLSPSDAWEMLIQEIANANADANPIGN